MSELIPMDVFSRALRSIKADPGSLSASSTIHTADFYGNAETWVAETYRREDGTDLVFLQRNAQDGGTRQVLPAEVTAALSRHRDQLGKKAKRRQGHKLAALRKGRGDKLGNPAALVEARKAQAAKKAEGAKAGPSAGRRRRS